MKTTRSILALILMMAGAQVAADEMYLKNGSVLIGTVVSAEAGSVVFNTPFSGDITVNAENIQRVVTNSTVTIMMADGTIYRDRKVDGSDGQLIVTSDDAAPVTYAATDIKLINPAPWKLGEGYNWTGNAGAAAEFERGNSDTDEWDLDVRTAWRSLRNRFTVDANFERDRNNGDKTTDNWHLWNKYDRFTSSDERNYWGGKIGFEYDRFQDLDLRTTIGPHFGRQFRDTPRLTLSGEIGPVYVDERFDQAEDDDYAGALWGINATSDIVGYGAELYLLHAGVLNFDSPEDLILNTRIGIRMPLIFGFETGAEVKYEYDGGAVEGVDEVDTTYNFRVGYAW